MSLLSTRGTLRGAGIVGAATMVGLGLEYVARTRISSALGPEGYGKVYLAMAGAYLLATAAQLGTSAGVRRFAALYMAEGVAGLASAYVRAGLLVTLLASIAIAVGLCAWAPVIAACLFGGAEEARLVRIAAWAIPGWALLEVAQSGLLAYRRNARAVAVTPLSDKILTLALLLPILAVAPSAAACLACLVAGMGIASLAGCWQASRPAGEDDGGPSPVGRVVRRLLSFSWPLQVGGLSTLLLFRLDATAIGAFASPREVGLVHAALPIAELTLVGFFGLAAVLTPPFMEYIAREDLDGFRQFYLRVQRWSLCVTGPLIALVLAFPTDLLTLLYTPDFAPATALLRVLAIGFLVAGVSGPCAPALVALGKPGSTMVAALGGLGVLCLADSVLLPHYGICALGVARIAGFMAFYGAGLAVLRSSLGPMPLASHAVRSVVCVLLPALGGTGMGAALGEAPTIVRLLSGGTFVLGLFVLAALRLNVITRGDLSLLRTAWRTSDRLVATCAQAKGPIGR